MTKRQLVPLVALVALVLPGPAHATYGGADGELAITFTQTDRVFYDSHIELVEPTGAGVGSFGACQDDTTSSHDDPVDCPSEPDFSPDGSRVAFALGNRLAVANADGSDVVVLPSLTDSDTDPSWSPKGTTLVFAGRERSQNNLYSVNPDGTALRRLTSRGGRAPAWSSRGEVAYVRKGTIYRMRPSVGRSARLAAGERPDFSPSGLSVLFASGRHVYSLSIRRDARRRLRLREADRAVFSPDARSLAYVARTDLRSSGEFYLSVVVARGDGTGARIVRRGREQPVGSTYANYVDVAWRSGR